MKLLYGIIFLGSIVHAQNLIGGCAGTRYGCCEDGVTAKEDYNALNCIKHRKEFVLSGYYGGDDAVSTDYSADSGDSSYQADSSEKTDYASEPDSGYNEDNPSPVSSDTDDFKDLTKNIAPAVKKIVPVIKKIAYKIKDKTHTKVKSKPKPKPKIGRAHV